MKRPLFTALLLLLLLAGQGWAQTTIRYVKSTGDGGTATGSGDDWQHASSDLQAMINKSSAGDQIWVASPLNRPIRRADAVTGPAVSDRSNAFVLKEGVKIYGGFPPGGGWSSRNPTQIVTTLTGEFASQWTDDGDDSNNAYHVVVAAGVSANTVLDGFTITGGRANNSSGFIVVNDQEVHADQGGGIYNVNSNATFANLTIIENKSLYFGGGVYNNNTSSHFDKVTITRNKVTNSYLSFLGRGGGMSNSENADVTLTDVLVSDNTAGTDGGGCYNENSTPVLTNVTISGNTAGDSGGEWYNNSGTPVIRNSIIWGNGVAGHLGNTQYSLIQNQKDNSDYNQETKYNLSSTIAPLFSDATSGNYRLSSNSPVINAGSNQYYWDAVNGGAALPDGVDLSGNLRIFNGAIDMGAYESQVIPDIAPAFGNILYVDQNVTGSNGSGGSWGNAIPELADALRYARELNNHAIGYPLKIYVAKGTYKPLYHAGDEEFHTNGGRYNSFVMVKNVQLYGGFDPGTGITELSHPRILPSSDQTGAILSGDLEMTGESADNAYSVVISAGDVENARLDGFTISGGNANSSSSIRVNQQSFQRNLGGGVCNWRSSPVLANVAIKGNEASYIGAGIYNYFSSLVLTNVAITGNTSSTFGGGGYNVASDPVLTNVTISGNTANTRGGEWFNASGTPMIRNSIIRGNGVTGNSSAPLSDTQYSLVQDQTITDNPTYYAITNHNLAPDTAPQFTDSNNGDYSLTNNSPLVNTGSNQFYWDAVNGGVALSMWGGADLSGNPRIAFRTIDIGAYESRVSPSRTPGPGNILYVDQNAADSDGSGSSWAHAIPELADALGHARTLNNYTTENPLKIYVAKGSYKPLYSADDTRYGANADRGNSFVMVKNVQLYGGFDPANGITELSHQRIVPSSEQAGTILSGDLGTPGENTDNAYRVVISAGGVGNAKLDGFTITGGNADTPLESITVNQREFDGNLGGAGALIWLSSPSLTNVRITGNVAGYEGGGIFNFASAPVLTSVAITGNTSAASGGGCYNQGSDPVLTNVTISGNTAATEESGEWYNVSGTPVVRNSIIWGKGVAGQLRNTQYSLVQSQTEADYHEAANHNLPSDTDPIFVQPADGDFTLLYSQAANAGNNQYYWNAVNGGTALPGGADLSGNPRIFNDIIDMGAYESQIAPITPGSDNILYVDQNVAGSDNTGSSWDNALTELADALRYARFLNNHTAENPLKIYVARGNYKPLYNAADHDYFVNADRSNSFVMVKNVQLSGGFDPQNGITELSHRRILPASGQAGTTLSGDLGVPQENTDNVHCVVISSGDVGNAILDGFTISGGNAESYSYMTVNQLRPELHYGGGVHNHYSSPTLINVTVTGNTAFSGGGIYDYESSPILSNVTISGNTATRYGGGIYSYYSYPVLTDVIITGNTTGTSGGGIATYDSDLVLTNVVITGNTAGYGGGISNVGNPILTNVIISGNTASQTGSEFQNEWSSNDKPVIRNSIIWGNGVTGNYPDTQYSLVQDQTEGDNPNYYLSSNHNLASDKDPLFANPVNGDYTLLRCSPAINAGTPDITGLNLPPTDLAGQPRVFADRIDMGAYESQELPSSGLVASSGQVETIQSKNGRTDYVNACNDWLASVTTSGQATDIEGSTTARVWMANRQPAEYVRRHYEITPAGNAGGATGRVTLYFTQADFDAFNGNNPSARLPDGPAGDITKLLIEKRGGVSSDGSGRPNTYPGSPETITNAEVNWNDGQQRWEVSFDVTGFSGFFVKTTSAPLPVRWISFAARLNEQHQGVPEWKVDESSVSHYEVERSANAKNFLKIAMIASLGDGIHQYSVTDPVPAAGNIYYRIRQVDLDGAYTYSLIVSVSAAEGSRLSVYPNPAADRVTVKVGPEYIGTKLRLINVAGVQLQEITVSEPILTLSMQQYATGIYMLYTVDGSVVKILKE